jgi:hypothetical protein
MSHLWLIAGLLRTVEILMTQETAPPLSASTPAPDLPGTRRGVLLVLGAAIIWSFGGAIARGLETGDPWAIVAWRSIFAALFLLAFMLWRDGPGGTVRLFRTMGVPGVGVGLCFASSARLMKASCGISTLPNWRIFFLPSFCFSSSLRLRVIAAIALGGHVLAQGANGFARDDHLAADGRLDRDLEHVPRDQLFQLFAHGPAARSRPGCGARWIDSASTGSALTRICIFTRSPGS